MAYAVCISYLTSSLDRKYHQRDFATKRETWEYVKAVRRHALARPDVTVDLTVVELASHKHVYRMIWGL